MFQLQIKLEMLLACVVGSFYMHDKVQYKILTPPYFSFNIKGNGERGFASTSSKVYDIKVYSRKPIFLFSIFESRSASSIAPTQPTRVNNLLYAPCFVRDANASEQNASSALNEFSSSPRARLVPECKRVSHDKHSRR